MTLSLVNISVSLNNVDCHLLFILLLSLAASQHPSLPLPSSSHSVWIDITSAVSIFLSSHRLSHLHSSLATSTFSTSLIAPSQVSSGFFFALRLPKPGLGDQGKVGKVMTTRMSSEYKKFDVVLLWPLTVLNAALREGLHRQELGHLSFLIRVQSALLPGTCRKCWIPGIWRRKTVRQAIWLEPFPQLREDPSLHNPCSEKQGRNNRLSVYSSKAAGYFLMGDFCSSQQSDDF